jgi:O-antigen ligase
MAARNDPIQWLIVAGFGALALLTGLIAGIDPPVSIGFSFAVAYGLLAFANLPAALALYCCEPFGYSFEESTIARIAVAMLLLSWLGVLMVEGSRARKLFVDHAAASGVLLLFLAWSLFSLVWAESPADGLVAFGRYTSGVAVMFIAYTVVRTRTRLTLVCAAVVVGGVLAALYGLAFGKQLDGRLAALSLDPNELASVLVPGVALSVALLVSIRSSPVLRVLLAAAAAFCILGTFLTASREGVIALVVVVVLGVVAGGRWRPQIALAGVLAVGLGVLYLTAFAPDSNRERILHAADPQQRQEGRTALWEVGWRIFRAHPVNGVGAGNFQDTARHYVLQPGNLRVTREIIDTPKVSHSTYVEFLTGLGIIGLGMFLIIDAFSIVCCVRAIREFRESGDRAGEALARGLLIGLIGLQVTHLFHSDEGNKQLWLLLALGPAVLAIAQASQAGQGGSAAEARS